MTPENDGPGGRIHAPILLRAAVELGPSSLVPYGTYRLSLLLGLSRRRTPATRWGARPPEAWLRPEVPSNPQAYLDYRRAHAARFLFDPEEDMAPRLRQIVGQPRAVLAEADAILEGNFRLFGELHVPLGFPPDWGVPADLDHTAARRPFNLQEHWTSSERVLRDTDVKLVWEISRFGWVFALVRAARLSGERRYADGFWTLLQTWMDANQPNCGVNWVSGQEVALRLLAVVFGVYGFARSWSDRPERLLTLAEFIVAHARRIPPTMAYARAQGNNHLLAEAAALYTAGILFPELKHAHRWRRIGRACLIQALRRQFFEDGGYIQHSTNYHRLVLEVATWAARLGSLNGDPLPDDCIASLGRSVACLEALVDPETGEAPNFGPNDGAYFLPLSGLPYRDYRPVVQLTSLVFRGRSAYPAGAWDEPCLWLGLMDELQSANASAPATGDEFPEAGLHFLRGIRGRAMVRCVRFSSRPGHSDQLHFDLWRDGRNVARDPGTYRYHADPPWDNALSQARVHNTVSVGGIEPMQSAGRFLWVNWDQGALIGRWRAADGQLEAIAAERDGYQKLGISHVRTVVRAGDDLWLVVDDLTRLPGTDDRMAVPPVAVAGWNLPDWLFALDGRLLTLEVPGESKPLRVEPSAGRAGLYRAGQRVAGTDVQPGLPTWGWWSRTYGHREPGLFLAVEAGGGLPLRLSTWWCFAGADPVELQVEWADPGSGTPSIRRLDYRGLQLDL